MPSGVTGVSQNDRSRHFLVTGASGFVGGNLVRMLVERGHKVTALVRKTSNKKALEALGVTFAYGDLATGEGLDEAVANVDVVLHLAGITKARTQEEYHRGNGEGTRLLAAAAARRKNPPRFVFCSSLAAAGPASKGSPRNEAHEPAPVSTYGRSKLAGEMAVRQFADKLPAIIVRPPIVYGPGDVTNLPPLMQMGRFGIYVKPGRKDRFFSFIHVDDLCEALILASFKGSTLSPDDRSKGVYFVADPNEYTWDEFCQAISKAMGKSRARILPMPEILSKVVGAGAELGGRLIGAVPIMNRDKATEMLCDAWTCNVERATNELQFKPQFAHVDHGLQHTMAWYRKEGML
ncbi:MAG: NAD-dependent epimerase/dehydratase family protein [Myxococcaceae bacterium]